MVKYSAWSIVFGKLKMLLIQPTSANCSPCMSIFSWYLFIRHNKISVGQVTSSASALSGVIGFNQGGHLVRSITPAEDYAQAPAANSRELGAVCTWGLVWLFSNSDVLDRNSNREVIELELGCVARSLLDQRCTSASARRTCSGVSILT